MNLDEKLWTSTSLANHPTRCRCQPQERFPHLVLRAAIHTNAATPCLIFSCFETIALPLGVRVLLPHVVSMNRSWHHRILLQNDGCVCVFFSENRLKKKKLYIYILKNHCWRFCTRSHCARKQVGMSLSQQNFNKFK